MTHLPAEHIVTIDAAAITGRWGGGGAFMSSRAVDSMDIFWNPACSDTT
jgi:hypothetical protein